MSRETSRTHASRKSLLQVAPAMGRLALLLIASADVGSGFAHHRRMPLGLRATPRSALAPWAGPRATLDLTRGADVAAFFLWGSPVPIAMATLLAVRERSETPEKRAGGEALEGAARSILFAFPSFGLFLQQPCEPVGMPRWQRLALLANSWAAIAHYLYYKYRIEDELREITGEGLGGAAVVYPFALALTGGVAGELLHGSLGNLLLGELDPFSALFWAGFAWIYICQFFLYVKINKLYTGRGNSAPLSTWGLLIPGYNLVTGIRQVHFLAKYTAEERNEEPLTDPFCAAFPFTTKPELGIVELVTKVELWYADWGAVTPSGADSE
mmetsp:Transcript_26396/g.65231  ORF Transcript_26396/g.65231 Transcript_26396/m.65231 type:complete len:327 (+) Transcript_26396:2-982(+)